MLIRTTREYDITHSGDEMDRLEILGALGHLAKMVNDADLACVEIESVKTDIISVHISEIDSP